MAKHPTAELLLLTWAAGMMDALSYLRAGVFTANMTGNTVVLGLGLAGADRWRVLLSSIALCSFSLGVFLGALVLVHLRRADDWKQDLRTGIGLEFPFAVAFALLSMLYRDLTWPAYKVASIATASCALGIQSVAVRRLRISGVVTTFITGTVTVGFASLVHPIEPEERGQERRSIALLFAVLICYALAAAVGAWLAHMNSVVASLIPVLVIAAVLLRSWMA